MNAIRRATKTITHVPILRRLVGVFSRDIVKFVDTSMTKELVCKSLRKHSGSNLTSCCIH